MTQDVPQKAGDSHDMDQIKQVREILDMEEEVEDMLTTGEDNSSSGVVQTVATNTTR